MFFDVWLGLVRVRGNAKSVALLILLVRFMVFGSASSLCTLEMVFEVSGILFDVIFIASGVSFLDELPSTAILAAL